MLDEQGGNQFIFVHSLSVFVQSVLDPPASETTSLGCCIHCWTAHGWFGGCVRSLEAAAVVLNLMFEDVCETYS